MKKVVLADGKEVLLGIRHGVFQIVVPPKWEVEERRITEVFLKEEGKDETFVEGLAVCHPKDNFSRKAGRKKAATELLKVMRQWAPERDTITYHEWLECKRERRRVFQTACPEFVQREEETNGSTD